MTPLVSVPKNPKKISGAFLLRGDLLRLGKSCSIRATPKKCDRNFLHHRRRTAFPLPYCISVCISVTYLPAKASSAAPAIHASLRARGAMDTNSKRIDMDVSETVTIRPKILFPRDYSGRIRRDK